MLSWLILGLFGGRYKRSPRSKLSLQLWSSERRGAGDSHLQSRWDHSSPSSSRSEQQVFVSAARPSAGDGVI